MTLTLTLKKMWFDMIATGEKREEYREIKHYWFSRLENNRGFVPFEKVRFVNGYNFDSPIVEVRCKGICKGVGNAKWGAPKDQRVYIIKLGKILLYKNMTVQCEYGDGTAECITVGCPHFFPHEAGADCTGKTGMSCGVCKPITKENCNEI